MIQDISLSPWTTLEEETLNQLGCHREEVLCRNVHTDLRYGQGQNQLFPILFPVPPSVPVYHVEKSRVLIATLLTLASLTLYGHVIRFFIGNLMGFLSNPVNIREKSHNMSMLGKGA